MFTVKNKFKSEIHLGLLAIIIAFLFLNVVSNFVIYKARNSERDTATVMMNHIAISISRNLGSDIITRLSQEDVNEYKKMYNLSGFILIPSIPENNDLTTRREWFTNLAGEFHPTQIPEIASKILTAEFQVLTKAEDNEYYYIYPIRTEVGKKLIILSKNLPQLAYFEKSNSIILWVSLVVILFLISIYFWLYRSILAPFKRFKKEAIDAGRPIDDEADDVEIMLMEYQNIISELRGKEAELTLLNESIQLKADSFESYNKYLLSSMVSGIISLNNEGEIISLNKAAEKILDILETDYLNKDINQLSFLNSDIKKLINKTLNDSINHPYQEYELDNLDGEEKTIGLTISAIYDNRIHRIGASLLINDITELKKLRTELESKNRLVALGEMAGGLAHQLRNSLGAILGYGSIIKKKMNLSGIETYSAEELQKETHEAENLIARFLDITRPFELNRETLDLSEYVKDLIESFKVNHSFESVDILLTDETEKNTIFVCDPLLLKQAITNLLDNAAWASKQESGKIEIILSEIEGSIQIEIHDNGEGIPLERIHKIFTPFYSSRPSGTGLGLPLVKKIIDLHNGTITVNSNPGTGSNFIINIPKTSQKSEKSLISS